MAIICSTYYAYEDGPGRVVLSTDGPAPAWAKQVVVATFPGLDEAQTWADTQAITVIWR